MTVIDQLKRDEGFRAKPYKDSKGFLSIGYGINLDAGTDEEEAEYWLSYRLNKSRQWMLSTFPWAEQLDDARFGAMLNMAYNLREKLTEFHYFLAAMQNGDWSQAAFQGRQSAWHEQVGDRAERLMRQVETGVWQ